jgi:hypothetical protein
VRERLELLLAGVPLLHLATDASHADQHLLVVPVNTQRAPAPGPGFFANLLISAPLTPVISAAGMRVAPVMSSSCVSRFDIQTTTGHEF